MMLHKKSWKSRSVMVFVFALTLGAISSILLLPRVYGQRASITVISPQIRKDKWGKEEWEVLDPGPWGTNTYTIRWTSFGVTGNVKIELSRNGGMTWETLFVSTPNDGKEDWRISGPATPNALIRISSVSNPTVRGTSGRFAIIGPYYKGFPGGYCTEYAARIFDQYAPSPGVNWRGNAQNWYTNASLAGWVVTNNPRDPRLSRGTIVVWSGGNWGHVAIVWSVTRDNSGYVTNITVQEMNWGRFIPEFLRQGEPISENFGKVTTTSFSVSNLKRGSLNFVGYILPRRSR